jgi:peptidoglycan/xylan/chitin deacetylase (PgdA/CDA1 family)
VKKFLKKSFFTLSGLPILSNLGNPWRGRACVLCYHRVLPDNEIGQDKSPNSNLIMPATLFTEQMEYLAKNHNVVSIDELVEHLEGDSNKFVVSVTFDDGYKDNFLHALPILERYLCNRRQK